MNAWRGVKFDMVLEVVFNTPTVVNIMKTIF